jgi:predicted transcriptional regulator
MKLPCEIVARDILPVLRALIAVDLVKSHGYSQNQAAMFLGITQPSVNYYLNAKRGSRKSSETSLKPLAKQIAKQLATSRTSPQELIKQICNNCLEMRTKNKNLICKAHKKALLSLKNQECTICADISKR